VLSADHVVEEGLLVHAVSRVEDDGRQQRVEEDLRVEGGRRLNVRLVLAGAVVLRREANVFRKCSNGVVAD
jgi:hypothetical protein